MNGNTSTPNKLGYTLVEIILVLALMGIVASIVSPSVKIISTYREEIEIKELKKDIMFTRNKAIMEKSIYTMTLNRKENKYSIYNTSKGFLVKEKNLRDGIVIVADNFNQSIVFYPTGAPRKAGSIRLMNSKKENIIITIIPATGRVNLKII